MTDFQQLAECYIDTWNAAPDDLARAVDALFTVDAVYVDPMADARGRNEIAGTIAAVHAQFPDFRFRLAGPVDGHHDQLRFGWELGTDADPAGEAPIAGFDVATVDDAGRLQQVRGFLDRVPG